MHETDTGIHFEVLIRKAEHMHIYYTYLQIIFVTHYYCVKCICVLLGFNDSLLLLLPFISD